jgi:16S rRNA (adenine1518-N6/adenine1519-N6)-dimethyltransferase
MTDHIAAHESLISSLPPLREIIATYGLSAEKKFGQNFLLDINLTDKIVRRAHHENLAQAGITVASAPAFKDINIIEIGPGPGGLTRSLLKSAAKSVSAIEIDPRAQAILHDMTPLMKGRLSVVDGDAMAMDITTLCPAPRALVANLPYNIATPLLIGWLRQIHADPAAFSSMTLMFQKEVGDRITAKDNTKSFGRLAVLCQFLCQTQTLFDLPPQAFTPPPKIKSSVVHFIPRQKRAAIPFETIESLTAAAFGQRRKMIRSSLKDYAASIKALNLDPTRRAETLSVDEFIALAKHHHETTQTI